MMNMISTLRTLHDAVFSAIERTLEGWFVPLVARLVFSSVLLMFFWNSALTKIGDSIFQPSDGAYIQILPKTVEALEYDIDRVSPFHTLIVLAGTYAEFILPILILVGLFTRLAATSMIGFIAVMSIVDITGHGIDSKTIGGFFDRFQDSAIADQRLLWVFPLVYLAIKGAGLLSLDAIFTRLNRSRIPANQTTSFVKEATA